MTADYNTFQDLPLDLVEIGDVTPDITFDTPNVDRREAANLTFEASPGGFATLRVEINGNLVAERAYNSGNPRAVSENFPGRNLDSAGNTLTVTKTAGTNKVTVSDFIVHYKTI